MPDSARERGWEDIDSTRDPSWYVRYLEDANRRLLTTKARRYPLLARALGDRVLDVGCGVGWDAGAMASVVGRAGLSVGVDRSRTVLDVARRRHGGRPGARFVVADARALPFASGTFDGCWAERVLQHVADPDLALAELVRVTAPGGRIGLSEPDTEMTRVDSDDHALTRRILAHRSTRRSVFRGSELGDRCRAVGLTDVHVDSFSSTATTFVAADQTMGLVASADAAARDGVVTQASADAWIAELEHRSEEDRFLVTWMRFDVIATKPSAADHRGDRAHVARLLRELGARAKLRIWFAGVRARHAARRLLARPRA